MEALDISINNCLRILATEENDEHEGVFIEEPMIYEDLANHDPENEEPIEKEALMPDVEYFESTDAYDQYISALAMLPKDDGFARELIMSCKQDSYGNIMVSRHSNPLIDICV